MVSSFHRAEGRCRKCGAGLDISGQCNWCAAEEIQMPKIELWGTVPRLTEPTWWDVPTPYFQRDLTLKPGYILLFGSSLFKSNDKPFPRADIIVWYVGEFVPLPAHEHAYWEAFTGWVD